MWLAIAKIVGYLLVVTGIAAAIVDLKQADKIVDTGLKELSKQQK